MTFFAREREAFERLMASAEEPVNLRRVYGNELLPESAIEITNEDYTRLDSLFGEMTCTIKYECKANGYKLKTTIPTMMQCTHIEIAGKEYLAWPDSIRDNSFRRMKEFFDWDF